MDTLRIIQLVIFLVGTIFIIYISSQSLRNLKAHGFYRFFVFESVLILIILNSPYWYDDPLSPQQIISWIFLVVSLFLVYQSFYLLRKIGGSKERENNSSNFEFENTATLVKNGVYKYIRHPMYGSLLFLSLGTFLKHVDISTVILSAISILFLILTAKVEEKENINFFGEQYRQYIKETKMFIPFIF